MTLKNARKSKSKKSKVPNQNKIPRANQLSLNNVQFTATTPLALLNVTAGSTPGGVRVKGRELIGSVAPGAALTGVFAQLNINGTTPFGLHPANFGRLAAYSPIYEFYKFHSANLIFQANQPTTAIGAVLIAADHDAKDAAPANAVSMMRNVSSTMSNIYSDSSLTVLGSMSRLNKYVCAQSLAPDNDQIVQANIYVAAEGVSAALGAVLGYVIISYDVEFFTPA